MALSLYFNLFQFYSIYIYVYFSDTDFLFRFYSQVTIGVGDKNTDAASPISPSALSSSAVEASASARRRKVEGTTDIRLLIWKGKFELVCWSGRESATIQ